MDYNFVRGKPFVKLCAEAARRMDEAEKCWKGQDALAVIENWQNDRSLSTHDVYKSIKVLGETMTSEEIMSHISVRERLWVDMIEHDYTEIAAAGILGNISWESGGYNVGELQGSLTEPKEGYGMGLCQWSLASRQQGLYAMAEEMGLSWDTYEVQIAFIFKEIDYDKDYKKARFEILNDATSVEEATRMFMDGYEKPRKDAEHFNERKEEAEKVYADYAVGR